MGLDDRYIIYSNLFQNTHSHGNTLPSGSRNSSTGLQAQGIHCLF